ncbi:MAG TPA: hypothetical protein VFC47_00370 [Caulobacteraceae bacterium]|nr:hypothetical protein [Caulobacteraceae bacterium]
MAADLVNGDVEARSGEAWIMGSHPDSAIRVRNLTLYLQRGGSLKDVRLVEGEDGGWTMWVRLQTRAGEYRINVYKSDAPKIYRDVGLAIACCRQDFGYFGPITLSTDKLPGGAAGQASKDADMNDGGGDLD